MGFNDWEPLLVYGKIKSPAMHEHDHFYAHPESPKNYGHPCPKPLLWADRLISQTVGPIPGFLVLDPFMGSGTVLCAAKAYGGRAIGIELEEKYCEEAARRLEQTNIDEKRQLLR